MCVRYIAVLIPHVIAVVQGQSKRAHSKREGEENCLRKAGTESGKQGKLFALLLVNHDLQVQFTNNIVMLVDASPRFK
jgi:hypothetical protein